MSRSEQTRGELPGEVRPVLAYRIVHLDNLEVLASRGHLHAPNHAPDDGRSYRAIHDQSIQARRGDRPVPCGPGGRIGDYVSFYLGPRSPMLYRIAQGEVPGYDGGQREVIYLVTSLERLGELDLRFVFTDGHSLASITRWYEDPTELRGPEWDWESIYAEYWFDRDDDPDRQRRKQAELLVHEGVPWEGLVGIATHDPEAADLVTRTLRAVAAEGPGSASLHVKPKPEWYY